MAKKPEPKKTSYSPNSRPVWCGEMTKAEREQINKLSAETRLAALLSAAAKFKPAPAPKPSPKKKVVKTAVKKAAKPAKAKKVNKPAKPAEPVLEHVESEQVEMFPETKQA